jgi:hypothetical protein
VGSSQERATISACRIWALCALVVIGPVSCKDGGNKGPRAQDHDLPISIVDGRPFDELFVTVESLVLEEPSGVVNVWPAPSMDPRGGFLVADTRENQLRVYSRTGKLERAFGAGTEGGDSIRLPVRASRLLNGSILVANILGQLTVIPEPDEDSARTIQTPLVRLRDVTVLNERQVLLVGLDSIPATSFLHVWDVASSKIVKSFFAPPRHFDKTVVATFPTVAVATRGNRLAAVYTFSDTVVFFDGDGIEVSRIRVPIDPFFAPTGPLPQVSSPAERQAWVNQFTLIQDLFWISDDQLVVQWAKGAARGEEWGIVQMDTIGRRVWGIAPAPRLFGVRGDEFFFQDPSADAVNHWIVAKQNTELVACLEVHRSNNTQGEDLCKQLRGKD